MIGIGVIGCGNWGPNYVRVFNFLKKTEVKVCCDVEINKLEKVKEFYPNIETTQLYEDVLDNNDVDAVVISTPTSTHYELAKASLEKGKDVLCEKPLTVKSEESIDLIEIAEKNKKILMVGHIFLFNEGIKRLRKYIEDEEFGDIYFIQCLRTNLGPIREDVNAVYDLASHDIYICSYLLNSKPTSALAKAEDFIRNGVEDVAFISLTYPNRSLANILVSWLNPTKKREITIVGSEKMAIWDDLNVSEPIRVYDKGIVKEDTYNDFGEFHYLTRDGDVLIPKIKFSEPLKSQAEHFIQCVEKREKPIADGYAGLDVVKTMEEIQNSINKSE